MSQAGSLVPLDEQVWPLGLRVMRWNVLVPAGIAPGPKRLSPGLRQSFPSPYSEDAGQGVAGRLPLGFSKSEGASHRVKVARLPFWRLGIRMLLPPLTASFLPDTSCMPACKKDNRHLELKSQDVVHVKPLPSILPWHAVGRRGLPRLKAGRAWRVVSV
jgi:hypothetical protein